MKMKVPCPKCGEENVGYYRDPTDNNYYFTNCLCPVPTMKQIAIEAGMHPEKTKEARP